MSGDVIAQVRKRSALARASAQSVGNALADDEVSLNLVNSAADVPDLVAALSLIRTLHYAVPDIHEADLTWCAMCFDGEGNSKPWPCATSIAARLPDEVRS